MPGGRWGKCLGVRKREGKERACTCAGASVLRVFTLSKGGDLREVLEEVLNDTFISFPGVSFQGHGLY